MEIRPILSTLLRNKTGPILITAQIALTLAIIDGFLVGAGEASYVVPLDMVVECMELQDQPRDRNYLNLRGEVLPFIRLRELFAAMREIYG